MESLVCQVEGIHTEVIQDVKVKMLDSRDVLKLSMLYKALGDSTRLKIMTALFHSRLCVCDLAVLLEMSQSAISHQLRVLRQADLVCYTKVGKVVYYELADAHVRTLLEQGKHHIDHL